MKNNLEEQLLIITRDFLSELQAERALQAVTLNASLERELGIDSLGKVELFHRIEKHFSLQLPENAIINTETLQDVFNIMVKAAPANFTAKTQTVSLALKAELVDLSTVKTMGEIVLAHAAAHPDRPHIYLQDEHGSEHIIHYGSLAQEAKNIARGLQKHGICPGETIAIMLPTSEAFFYVYCGILLAGAIPVPIYPPFRPDRIEEYAKREIKILQSAQVRLLVTFSRAEILSHMLRTFVPSLKEVVTIKNLQTPGTDFTPVIVEPSDPALIQYTSGSTGDPKGVLLTHENMLANIRGIQQSVPVQQTDAVVSWLPLYHDMGLMSWLGSLYYGIPLTLLSPITFLARPERWLWAIHYHRATLSGGPNFAYELCVKKINPSDIEGLDLSSWRFAFNGAEAINPRTLERFHKKFAPYGFKADSFAPVYGLAESTVALTFPSAPRVPRIDKIDRVTFEKEHRAVPSTNPSEKNFLEFVACGAPMAEHALRIVDDNGDVLNDREIGNIQFRGASAMQGYFNNPAATQKAYHQGWWESGDLGYLAENDVFIVGRKKDLIIKAGRNLYPEEVEDIVNQIPSIRKGCTIAFGVNDALTGTEKLIVVAETYAINHDEQQTIRNEIIEKMAISLGIPPDSVILVAPHTVPKTSSGKLQRSAGKAAYLKGELKRPNLPAKIQIAKLGAISLSKKTLSWVSYLGKLLYTGYIALIVMLTLPFVLLIIFFLTRKSAGHVMRFWARTLFRLAGCRIIVEGKENLKNIPATIFAANHASYLDAMLLIATLPADVVFIGKRELLNNFLFRFFIKKLTYLTIDRMDFSKSIENKSLIEETVKQGRSIAIFPEGTFTYATGLRPFKLGAFIIASETQTPICPIAIRGTRVILRGDNKFFKPGTVQVTIGKLIYPKQKNWDEMLRLHLLIRAEIAKHCGEPVIDMITAGPVSI
jgi:fatty-acyl-CoA synthase